MHPRWELTDLRWLPHANLPLLRVRGHHLGWWGEIGGRWEGDGRELRGKWKGDGREMGGRCEGDGREAGGRCEGDGREIGVRILEGGVGEHGG